MTLATSTIGPASAKAGQRLQFESRGRLMRSVFRTRSGRPRSRFTPPILRKNFDCAPLGLGQYSNSAWSVAAANRTHRPPMTMGELPIRIVLIPIPPTWHLIVTHQLGRLHRSFILDSSYDNQVWNQPAKSYVYSYFNPQTGKSTQAIADAKVAMTDFTNEANLKRTVQKVRSRSSASRWISRLLRKRNLQTRLRPIAPFRTVLAPRFVMSMILNWMRIIRS